MSESNNNVPIICLAVFATVSSFAWAVAIGNIYTPPGTPKSAKETCAAAGKDARNSVFCLEIAKQP